MLLHDCWQGGSSKHSFTSVEKWWEGLIEAIRHGNDHNYGQRYQYTLGMNDSISTITGCIIAGQLVASPAAALFYLSSIYTKAVLRTTVILRTLISWCHCRANKSATTISCKSSIYIVTRTNLHTWTRPIVAIQHKSFLAFTCKGAICIYTLLVAIIYHITLIDIWKEEGGCKVKQLWKGLPEANVWLLHKVCFKILDLILAVRKCFQSTSINWSVMLFQHLW